MEKEIIELREKGIKPKLRKISLEKYLKKQGRYTNRKFWKTIILYQKMKRKLKDDSDFTKERIEVTNIKEFNNGFEEDYYQLLMDSNFAVSTTQ